MPQSLVTLRSAAATVIPGGAAPGKLNHRPVIDFDASTDESVMFEFTVPYDRNVSLDMDVKFVWTANATTGSAVIDVSLERIQPDVTNLNADNFTVTQSGTFATFGTAYRPNEDSVTFSSASIASVAVPGEGLRLRFTRDANNGSDNLAVDLRLYHVTLEQPIP